MGHLLRRDLALALRAGWREPSLVTSDSNSSTRRFSSPVSSGFPGPLTITGGGAASASAGRCTPGTDMKPKGFSGDGMERYAFWYMSIIAFM